jgi:hypothetical protein
MQQNQNRIKSFVDSLSNQDVDSEIVFNQYHEVYNFPQFFTTKTNLLLYLTQMIDKEPQTVLIGEAPGKNGCALTGINKRPTPHTLTVVCNFKTPFPFKNFKKLL